MSNQATNFCLFPKTNEDGCNTDNCNSPIIMSASSPCNTSIDDVCENINGTSSEVRESDLPQSNLENIIALLFIIYKDVSEIKLLNTIETQLNLSNYYKKIYDTLGLIKTNLAITWKDAEDKFTKLAQNITNIDSKTEKIIETFENVKSLENYVQEIKQHVEKNIHHLECVLLSDNQNVSNNLLKNFIKEENSLFLNMKEFINEGVHFVLVKIEDILMKVNEMKGKHESLESKFLNFEEKNSGIDDKLANLFEVNTFLLERQNIFFENFSKHISNFFPEKNEFLTQMYTIKKEMEKMNDAQEKFEKSYEIQEKFQKDMEDKLAAIKKFQKSMEEKYDSQEKFQKHMEEKYDSQETFQKHMEEKYDSQEKFQKHVEYKHDVLEKFQKSMEEKYNIQEKFQKDMEDKHAALAKFQKNMEEKYNDQEKFQAKMNSFTVDILQKIATLNNEVKNIPIVVNNFGDKAQHFFNAVEVEHQESSVIIKDEEKFQDSKSSGFDVDDKDENSHTIQVKTDIKDEKETVLSNIDLSKKKTITSDQVKKILFSDTIDSSAESENTVVFGKMDKKTYDNNGSTLKETVLNLSNQSIDNKKTKGRKRNKNSRNTSRQGNKKDKGRKISDSTTSENDNLQIITQPKDYKRGMSAQEVYEFCLQSTKIEDKENNLDISENPNISKNSNTSSENTFPSLSKPPKLSHNKKTDKNSEIIASKLTTNNKYLGESNALIENVSLKADDAKNQINTEISSDNKEKRYGFRSYSVKNKQKDIDASEVDKSSTSDDYDSFYDDSFPSSSKKSKLIPNKKRTNKKKVKLSRTPLSKNKKYTEDTMSLTTLYEKDSSQTTEQKTIKKSMTHHTPDDDLQEKNRFRLNSNTFKYERDEKSCIDEDTFKYERSHIDDFFQDIEQKVVKKIKTEDTNKIPDNFKEECKPRSLSKYLEFQDDAGNYRINENALKYKYSYTHDSPQIIEQKKTEKKIIRNEQGSADNFEEKYQVHLNSKLNDFQFSDDTWDQNVNEDILKYKSSYKTSRPTLKYSMFNLESPNQQKDLDNTQQMYLGNAQQKYLDNAQQKYLDNAQQKYLDNTQHYEVDENALKYQSVHTYNSSVKHSSFTTESPNLQKMRIEKSTHFDNATGREINDHLKYRKRYSFNPSRFLPKNTLPTFESTNSQEKQYAKDVDDSFRLDYGEDRKFAKDRKYQSTEFYGLQKKLSEKMPSTSKVQKAKKNVYYNDIFTKSKDNEPSIEVITLD